MCIFHMNVVAVLKLLTYFVYKDETGTLQNTRGIRKYCRISSLKRFKNNSEKHLSWIMPVLLILHWGIGTDQVTSQELLQLFPVILMEDSIHFSVAWSKPLTLFCFGNTFLNLNSEGKDTCSPLSCLKQLLYLHRPYEKLTLRGLFVCTARYFRNADSFYQAEGVHTGPNCHQIRRRRT